MANLLVEIDSFIKTSNYASKTESVLNRTICSNLNIHHTFGTPKILKTLVKNKHFVQKYSAKSFKTV